jgi:uncharacterized protein
MIAAAALVLLAGFLVGATTLGGLIVVPALTTFAGMPLDRAVAVASAALLVPSFLAARAAWADSGHRRTVLAVSGAAIGGAAAGAAALAYVPGVVTVGLLAVLALIGGVQGLSRHRVAARAHGPGSLPVVTSLAGVAGVLSALTGTGGPVSLWPLMTIAAQPVALTWIAALAIQFPVGLGASAANVLAGRLDYALTAGLAALLVAGFLAGRRWSARASTEKLARAASVMLIVVAVWLAATLVNGGVR